MTSIIKLTALSGVQEESALCYLLQVDEFRFLLDCGWDESFSMDIIDSLKRYVHQVDAVLLSHPDHLHLGALPYAVGKLGLNCTIYATIPVYKMGQMFMYDLYQSRHNTEDFTLFTLDDVDSAFDKIQQLKYSQIVNLKGKGHGLSITPLPAGHMIGGTIWKIVKDGEEEIIYGVDFNHKREIHLNGCSLENISRPSLLITDSFNASYVQPRRKQRDEQLLTNVMETLRGDGNVLIAVDTAGRVLELAQLLDQIWRTKDAGLGVYSLALLNNVSYNVVEFSKSQVSLSQSSPFEMLSVWSTIISDSNLQWCENVLKHLRSELNLMLMHLLTQIWRIDASVVSLRARVTYIDYEGRSDGDSIKKIINQMKPRQLIIVHGPPEASQDLAESCKAFSGKDIKVYTPKLQETVDATSETHIYQVRLKDSLVSSLQFCKAKDTELAWIDGVLDMRVEKVDTGVVPEMGDAKEETEDGEPAVDVTPDLTTEPSAAANQQAMKTLFGEDDREISEESDVIPTLEPLPAHEVPGHQSVFINEPRLSDFKQVLLREGIQAEFVGGVLVCNNLVAVRRTEAGRICLEGCHCDDYYRIRELLYQQYAVV
uniref:Cleavage and polyadenylation specificity factor subunit 2 n=1 Tax=Sinocyclocheilus grahami TaxID=75366 RepID=A0A672SAD6_SINGR